MDPYQPYHKAWSSSNSGAGPKGPPRFPHMSNWQPSYSQMMVPIDHRMHMPGSRQPISHSVRVPTDNSPGLPQHLSEMGRYVPHDSSVIGRMNPQSHPDEWLHPPGPYYRPMYPPHYPPGYYGMPPGIPPQGYQWQMTPRYPYPVEPISEERTKGTGASRSERGGSRSSLTPPMASKGRRKQKPRKVDQQNQSEEEEELGDTMMIFDPRSNEILFNRPASSTTAGGPVKTEPEVVPVVLPTGADSDTEIEDVTRHHVTTPGATGHVGSAVRRDSSSTDQMSFLPDSTCPDGDEFGRQDLALSIHPLDIQYVETVGGRRHEFGTPLTDYTRINEHGDVNSEPALFIEQVNSLSVGSTNVLAPSNKYDELGEYEGGSEAKSVECESFHASSPEGAGSEIEEPGDIVVETGNRRGDKHMDSSARDTKLIFDDPMSSVHSSSRKKNFICHKYGCNFFAGSYAKMRRHNQTHLREQLTTGKFKCLLCPFANNHKIALSIHSVIHEDIPPFRCKQCRNGTYFDTAKKLNVHIQTHTGENKFTCAYENCLYTSNLSSNMNRHYRLKHGSVIPSTSIQASGDVPLTKRNEKLKCEHCAFASSHTLALQIHSVVHKTVTPFTCSHCNKGGFESVKKLSSHIKTHTGESEFSCAYSSCFFMTNFSSNLSRHYRLNHDGDLPPSNTISRQEPVVFSSPNWKAPTRKAGLHCSVDESSHSSTEKLTGGASMSASEVDNRLGISVGRSDTTDESIEERLQFLAEQSTLDLQKRFHCDECDYRTNSAQNLRMHEFKHKSRFRCTLCSYSSLHEEMFRRHYSNVHKKRAPRYLTQTTSAQSWTVTKNVKKCELCDYRTLYQDDLSRHQENKHVLKKCSMCSYVTVDRKQYNLHVESHVTGELIPGQDSEDEDGEFICEKCDFRTKLLAPWKAHVCSVEGSPTAINTSNLISSLEKMVNSHGEDDFVHKDGESWKALYCRRCKMSFETEDEYNAHGKSVHVGSFECNLCDFSSHHEQWLISHMKIHLTRSINDNYSIQKCHLCSYTAIHRGRMKQHMDTHMGNRPYHCKACSFRTGSISNMYRHVRGKHKIFDLHTLKSYVRFDRSSKVSDRIESTVSRLSSHFSNIDTHDTSSTKKQKLSTSKSKTHAGESEISFRRKKSVDMQRHREDITPHRKLPRIFSCDKCYYTTRDEDSLTVHKKSVHHTESVNSGEDTAAESSSYTEKLAEIVKEEDQNRFINLPLPELEYSQLSRTPARTVTASHDDDHIKIAAKDLLISTTMRVDGKAIPKYKCKSCGDSSNCRRTTMDHIETAHIQNASPIHIRRSAKVKIKPAKQYYCQECEYKTPVTTNLRYHYKVHHPNCKAIDPAFAGFKERKRRNEPNMLLQSAPIEFEEFNVENCSQEEETLTPAPVSLYCSQSETTKINFISNSSVPVTETRRGTPDKKRIPSSKSESSHTEKELLLESEESGTPSHNIELVVDKDAAQNEQELPTDTGVNSVE